MASIVVKRRNYGWLAIEFSAILFVGILLSFYGFDELLLEIVKKQANLLPNTIPRYLYENLPFPLLMKVYIFNVTNENDVQNGGKPKLQEVGPYVFHQYLKKFNSIDNEYDDTIEFAVWKKFVFRPELSNGLTGEEVVTTLHPVIVSLGLVVHSEYQTLMRAAIVAIKELFHDPTNVFWTGRAMDLMFDGIPIDCSSTKPLVKVVCGEIRNSGSSSIKIIDNTTFHFSLFGGINFTMNNGVFKVLRGSRDYRDLGRVVAVDGKTELDVWNGKKCNQILGTDGLIFPPVHPKDEPIYIYARTFCHSVDLNFARKTRFRGMHLFQFDNDFNYTDVEKEENRCFCRRPDYCPLKGTIDLFPCLKVPIIGTLPHFYRADKSLMENIASGIRPDHKKHNFFLNMELRSGFPVTAALRLQLNFELEPIERIEIMSNLRKMVFPFVWFDESGDVPGSVISAIKYGVYFMHSFVQFMKYTCIIFGLFGSVINLLIFLSIKHGQVSVADGSRSISDHAEIHIIGNAFTEAKSIAVKSVKSIIPGANTSTSTSPNVTLVRHQHK